MKPTQRTHNFANQIPVEVRRAIERLNNHTSITLQFRDLRRLQLPKSDYYSSLTETSLRSLLPTGIILLVFSKRWPKEFQLNCLRWVARGLNPQLAIAKIELDIVAITYKSI